ncbi:MAG: DUF3019 domain-containing protein [Gammaproteobacteria bacterium]|nr:DUF3019 domain-containing protein [Gammaproteobacteria bacterium]
MHSKFVTRKRIQTVTGLFNVFFGIVLLSLLSSFLFSFNANAQTLIPAEPVKVEEFELMPLICVTTKVGDTCRLKLSVRWQTNVRGDFCFFQNEQEIFCWQQQKQVKQSIEVALVKSSVFSLKQKGLDKSLIQQQVTLNYSQSERYRRRLRSQWSIF